MLLSGGAADLRLWASPAAADFPPTRIEDSRRVYTGAHGRPRCASTGLAPASVDGIGPAAWRLLDQGHPPSGGGRDRRGPEYLGNQVQGLYGRICTARQGGSSQRLAAVLGSGGGARASADCYPRLSEYVQRGGGTPELSGLSLPGCGSASIHPLNFNFTDAAGQRQLPTAWPAWCLCPEVGGRSCETLPILDPPR